MDQPDVLFRRSSVGKTSLTSRPTSIPRISVAPTFHSSTSRNLRRLRTKNRLGMSACSSNDHCRLQLFEFLHAIFRNTYGRHVEVFLDISSARSFYPTLGNKV